MPVGLRMRSWWVKLQARGLRPLVMLGYLAVVLVFLGAFSRYHIPEKGFSYLVSFGGRQPHPPIDELKSLDYYVQADSDGYDAQYYVQIAMDPSLRNPQLHDAVDSLAYRARRILISALSYSMGLGNPEYILSAYVLQNAISWLLLAGVLLWWFPPKSWNHWLRWTGVLFSFGMCVSVRNSLVDGPSLLLIALGVLLLEKGRPWWSAVVLGLGGLGKETNLLGAAALLRNEDVLSPRRWAGLVLRGILVAIPLALWLVYIQHVVGPAADLGSRNFDWPFMAFGRKWVLVWQEVISPHSWTPGIWNNGAFWSFLMMLTISIHFLFLVFCPSGKSAWWRVGFSFAVLMVVLGDAVWEGYPGAASRVLLPMQLAFNVLLPVGKRWWPLLILGNLTLLNAPVALQPPPGDGYELHGSENLIVSPEHGRLRVQFGPEWHEPERYRDRYWRWSRGSSWIKIINPHAFPLEADMDFILSALKEKRVVITGQDGNELWKGEIADSVTRVSLSKVLLRPGQSHFSILTDDSQTKASDDARPLSYCLKDWVITLRPSPHDGAVITGPESVLGRPEARKINVEFEDGWYEAERHGNIYWRWSGGAAEFAVINDHDTAVTANLSFVLNAISKRVATLKRADGPVIWEAEVSSKHSETADLREIILNPGVNRFEFKTDQAPGGADADTRLLDLSLKNLVIEILP